MHPADYPPDWNHHSALHEDLAAVLAHADCGWTQVMCCLGFATCCILGSYDDQGRRVAMAQILAGKLLETAETGRMPWETVQ